MFIQCSKCAYTLTMIAALLAVQIAKATEIVSGQTSAQKAIAGEQDEVKVPNLPLPRNDTSAPDVEVRPLARFDPWRFAFRPLDRAALTLSEEHHLTFAGWYTFFDQYSSDVVAASPRHNQLGGRGEVVGEWKPINTEFHSTSLNLLARTENNIGISQRFDLSDASGSVMGTNSLQGGGRDLEIGLYLFYLEQALLHKKLIVDVGKLHTNSFIDLSTMADAEWTQFMSGAYTGNASNPQSGLWSSGVAVQYNFSNHLYLHALAIDADGKATTGPASIKNSHFYEAAEIGYKRGFVTQQAIDYRAFYWHQNTSQGQGNGGGVGFDHELRSGLTPFGRWGYASTRANAIRQFGSLGLAHVRAFGRHSDLVAIAASWGQPSDPTRSSSYRPGSSVILRNEIIFETYYRVRVTRHMEMTPDLEVLVHPINQPKADVVAVPGFRMRVIF